MPEKVTLQNGFEAWSWQVGPSTYLAAPQQGARLMSWDIAVAGKKRSILHWPHGEEGGARFASIRGGNPILFPFVARTFEGGQLGFWKTPEGERLPMQVHGYARQGDFEVESLDEAGFTARFLPSEACREAYPYRYTFRVEYRFRELDCEVDLVLDNHDERPIPWCAGHHFYFTLPWHEGAKREDYRITIPAKKAFYHSGEGKLEPVKLEGQSFGFESVDLADRIHCKLKDNRVLWGPKSGEEDMLLEIGEQRIPSAWTALVTWTEREDSPFYCVEPWMGPPNAPEHKKGLHFVESGQSGRFRVRVAFG